MGEVLTNIKGAVGAYSGGNIILGVRDWALLYLPNTLTTISNILSE